MTRVLRAAVVVLALAPGIGSAQVRTATFAVGATVIRRATIPLAQALGSVHAPASSVAATPAREGLAGADADRRDEPARVALLLRPAAEARAAFRVQRTVVVFVDGAPPEPADDGELEGR